MRGWQIIFLKEFREVLRDPRARFSVFVSPLLLTPLILAIVGTVARKQALDARASVISVGVIGLGHSPALSALMAGEANLKLVPKTRAEAEAAIRARALHVAAVFPDDADAALAEMRPISVTLLLDEGSQASKEASDRLDEMFKARGSHLTAQWLQAKGLSPQLATPFTMRQEAVPGGSSASMLLLSVMLPYVLSVTALMSGVSLANDSVAGEKERGTLETLLVSPLSRRDIALGKFAAVVAVSLAGTFLSLVGIIWPFYVKLPFFSWMTRSGLTLSPLTVLAVMLVQFPLAIMGAGMLLMISTISRNQKEAQTYLTPVLLTVTVLGMLTMFLNVDAPLYWTLVPVSNAAMVVKQALEGVTNVPFLIAACLASALYAAVAVAVAAHLFQKESVLLKM